MLEAQSNATGESVSRLEAEALAASAYIFGFPLVLADAVHTAVARAASAPLVDETWDERRWIFCLDLAQESFILRMSGGTLQVRDAWTETVAAVTAPEAGPMRAWALLGPRRHRELSSPLESDCEPIVSRTDLVCVVAESPRCVLVPWRAAGERPATALASTARWRLPAAVEQVSRMGAGTFLSRLARLMRSNPPGATDDPLLARLRRIGIASGEPTRLGCLPPDLKPLLVSGVAAARAALAEGAEIAGASPERCRSDYLGRALWASRNLLGPPARDR
jgi:hypothetical protein